MRVAVLGAGSIGRRHLGNLRRLGVSELLVQDPDPAAGRAAAAEHGAAAVRELEEVWAWGPGAVLVASPSHLHLEPARQALLRGCHLFVEKPLAHRTEGVAELVALAGERGLVTMVGCNLRFHPGPARLKELLAAGAAGQVLAARLHTGSYLPGWRPGRDYRQSYSALAEQGGGVLLDCIHEIDLALWLLGPARLAAAVAKPAAVLGLAVEGLAELILAHQNGAVGSVHLNFVQCDYRRTIQIVGSEASLYWDFARPEVWRRAGGGEETRFPLDPAWEINQMYVDEMAHFLACVRAGRPTLCPLAQGAAALELALAAKTAAGKGATA